MCRGDVLNSSRHECFNDAAFLAAALRNFALRTVGIRMLRENGFMI